jgi:hypothetical protein
MTSVDYASGRRVSRARAARGVVFLILAGALLQGCMQPSVRRDMTSPAALGPSPWAAHTSTVRWNEYACEMIARNQAGQFPALRTLAYLNPGIDNAIVMARTKGIKPQGAAAGAAAEILVYFFPKEEQVIASRLARETAALGAKSYRPDFVAGVEVGRSAGADVIAMAKADRANVPWSGTLPTGAGKWSSLTQPPTPPLGPQLAAKRPFFLVERG